MQNPKPIQTPHPLSILAARANPHSGMSQSWDKAGSGTNVTPDQLDANLKRLDALLAEAGRSRADERIQVSPRERYDTDVFSRFRDSGVDQVVLPLFGRDAESLRKRADALAADTLA